MENTEQKKLALIQAWDDWDAKAPDAAKEDPKLCRVENPDCEACQ